MGNAKVPVVDQGLTLNQIMPICDIPEQVPPDLPIGMILSKIPYSAILSLFGGIIFGKAIDLVLGKDGHGEINPQVFTFDYKGYNITTAVKLSVRKK